jgi:hypothetical protein
MTTTVFGRLFITLDVLQFFGERQMVIAFLIPVRHASEQQDETIEMADGCADGANSFSSARRLAWSGSWQDVCRCLAWQRKPRPAQLLAYCMPASRPVKLISRNG